MSSGFRRQQHRSTFQVFFATKAFQRDALKHFVALCIQQALRHLRRKEARAERIHVDVVVAPFGRQRAGEVDHGPFAGVVGDGLHAFRVAGQPGDGGNVDYLAGLARDHTALAHSLGQEEAGVDVQVHHFHPAFRRIVFRRGAPGGAGVVHQNVDVTELLHHLIDHLRNTFKVAQIGGDSDDFHTLTFQVFLCRIQLMLLARADGDFRAQLAQCLGHLKPQAARAAGDESHFAGQVQQLFYAHEMFLNRILWFRRWRPAGRR